MSNDMTKPAARPDMVVNVLSSESLKLPSSLLLPRRRLRPYVALSTTANHSGGEPPRLYRTRADEKGAANPTWHDTIRLSVDPSFLVPCRRRRSRSWEEEDDSAAVHISVMSKGWLGGCTELGWCRIFPGDVIDGLRLPGMHRRLSYVLRTGRHGARGHGIIHLSVILEGVGVDRIALTPRRPPEQGWDQVAVGIPVAAVA